jgi:hypothetical protein
MTAHPPRRRVIFEGHKCQDYSRQADWRATRLRVCRVQHALRCAEGGAGRVDLAQRNAVPAKSYMPAQGVEPGVPRTLRQTLALCRSSRTITARSSLARVASTGSTGRRSEPVGLPRIALPNTLVSLTPQLARGVAPKAWLPRAAFCESMPGIAVGLVPDCASTAVAGTLGASSCKLRHVRAIVVGQGSGKRRRPAKTQRPSSRSLLAVSVFACVRARVCLYFCVRVRTCTCVLVLRPLHQFPCGLQTLVLK